MIRRTLIITSPHQKFFPNRSPMPTTPSAATHVLWSPHSWGLVVGSGIVCTSVGLHTAGSVCRSQRARILSIAQTGPINNNAVHQPLHITASLAEYCNSWSKGMKVKSVQARRVLCIPAQSVVEEEDIVAFLSCCTLSQSAKTHIGWKTSSIQKSVRDRSSSSDKQVPPSSNATVLYML